VRHVLFVVAASCAVGTACGDETDKTDACDLGQTESAATVQDRKIIGAVAPYTADLSLATRDDELRTSIAARRAAAWEVVGRVLAPTPLAEPMLASQFGGQPVIPAWHTWFGRDDFDRVFKKLYADLGPTARAARAPLDTATIDAGFAWNTTALDELTSEWPEQRYNDYLAAIDSQDKVQGIGGINRVGYSTGAMRALIGSYAEEYACRLADPPDAFDTQPLREGQHVDAAEHVEVGTCEWRVLGPYVASARERVTVTATGDGDADIYVRRGMAPEAHAFDCKSAGGTSTETCAVDGGGLVYVAVFGAAASTVEISVGYTSEDVALPTCLAEEMPRNAVLVKADWRRDLGDNLPIFDTSAARMRERFQAQANWADGDGSANPGASIYAVTLPNGNSFRLPGLHIMTKELDHWMWITLWWSNNPDTDFGADRPAAVASLPGPWKNYKMCVVSQYLEGDADPRGGFSGSLGDSLEAVSGGTNTPSWCSNPYLELGAGNAQTNCIGCHQHGGTPNSPEEILAMPHHGSTRLRNNFFTDYLWAIKGGQGEDLSALIQAEVDFWDATDP
jgi:hypothetical protein